MVSLAWGMVFDRVHRWSNVHTHGPETVEYPGHLGHAQPHALQFRTVAEHLPGRALKGDAAVVDHHQPVHRAGHLLHGVGDQDDGGIVGLVIVPDVAQDGLHSHRVQPGGGLVQNEHPGLHGDAPRDGPPPLLAAGELKGGLFQLVVPQSHEAGGLPHPAVHLPLVQPHVFRAEGDVLVDGLLKELVLRVLEHQTRQETEIPDLFRFGPEVAAINDDLAAGGFVQTVHVGDEGALAGAGGSDDAHEIALFHLKAHVVQRSDCVRHTGVVDIAQVFYFDNACHVSVPLTSAAHTEPVRTRRCR